MQNKNQYFVFRLQAFLGDFIQVFFNKQLLYQPKYSFNKSLLVQPKYSFNKSLLVKKNKIIFVINRSQGSFTREGSFPHVTDSQTQIRFRRLALFFFDFFIVFHNKLR